MRGDRFVAAIAIAVAFLTPRAHAGGEKTISTGGVSVTVRTPWPDMLNRGAQPMLVEVWNSTTEARRVSLSLSNGYATRRDALEKSLDVAGGERQTFELFAPVQSHYSSAYTLEVRAGGENAYVPGVGASQQPELDVRNVLVLTRDLPDASQRGAWQDDFSRDGGARGWVARAPMSPGQRLARLGYAGAPATLSTTGSTADPVRVTAVVFRDLPARYEAYTSIDGVVIDANAGLPDADKLAAVIAWTRLGGRLAIFGPNALRLARSSNELAPWLEDRFKAGERDDTWLCGQGLIVVRDSAEVLDSAAQSSALNAAMEKSPDWIPKDGGVRAHGLSAVLPGLELPYRALTLILVLFAIVIGPVNFYVVRKMGKPALLLATVPAIAFVFSLGLFVYGALAQGLDVRAVSSTFTLLDQREHRSSGAEVRTLFAGLSAGSGLRPGPGTSAWCEVGASNTREQKSLRIDFSRGTLLGGDYLPVRTPVRHTILVDRPCRLRVDVRREADAFVIENGLGVAILSLVLRDAEGNFHKLATSIPAGGRATLAPMPEGPSDAAQAHIVAAAVGVDGGHGAAATAGGVADNRLPAGSYSAVIEGAVFADRCDVEARELESAHRVVGILDMDGLR